MIGQVVAVNYTRGLVAFEIESGDFGYFEVLDMVEFEKEDKIKRQFRIFRQRKNYKKLTRMKLLMYLLKITV